MAPPLRQEQRQLIIALREKGMRIVDICQRIGVSKKTVYLWLRRHDSEGTVERQRRDQFFRKTTVEEDRAIVAAHIENPSMSTSTTAAQFQVSNLTIRRRLHQAGVRHRKTAKKKKSDGDDQHDNRVGQVGSNDGKVSWALEKFECNGDPSTVSARWDRWKRALFIYLDAAHVTAPEKKRASLLYFGGYELQQIFYNIVGANVEPAEGINVFEVAVGKLDAYFAPKQSKMYERNLFRLIKQKPNEKFDKFLARLRQQANKCRYIDPDEHIMDQIVEKGTSKELRKKIFQKGDSITLDDIAREANSFEAIKKQTDEFARNNTKKGIKKKRVVKKRKPVNQTPRPEDPKPIEEDPRCPNKEWLRKQYCKTMESVETKKYEAEMNSSAFKKFRPVMNSVPGVMSDVQVMSQMPMAPQPEPDGMNYFF